MIDSGDIARHYIVRKNDEITSIETAGSSNVADEEVIYNALGHSIFSILNKKNVIFEGWKDKRLFQVFLGSANAELKKMYKEVGICHAKGAKSIKTITPMIELAGRECIIVSDSDRPAKEQRKLYKQEKGYGVWKTYQDIDSTIEAITGEDFLKNDYIIKQINGVLPKGMPSLKAVDLSVTKEKLAVMEKWLITNGMSKLQANDTIVKTKNVLFENLKHQNIESSYASLAKQLF